MKIFKLLPLLFVLLFTSCGGDEEATLRDGSLVVTVDGTEYTLNHTYYKDFWSFNRRVIQITASDDLNLILAETILFRLTIQLEEGEVLTTGDYVNVEFNRSVSCNITLDICGAKETYIGDTFVTLSEVGDLTGSFSTDDMQFFVGVQNIPCSPDEISISGTFQDIPFRE